MKAKQKNKYITTFEYNKAKKYLGIHNNSFFGVDVKEKTRQCSKCGKIFLLTQFMGHNKKCKECQKKHNKQNTARYLAKRKRDLGFNPLNEPFLFSHGHHINDNDVVYIPAKIHRMFLAGPGGTERHRALVLQYYGSVANMLINKPAVVKSFEVGFMAGRRYEKKNTTIL